MPYSSFSKRIFAAIFDMALISLITMLLADFIIDMERLQPILDKSSAGGQLNLEEGLVVLDAFVMLALISTALFLMCDVILTATRMMGSPGKYILGMVIVDGQGKRLSFGKAFGRHAAKFLSMISVFGCLMPLWHPKRQALHDKMCATFVVKKRTLEVI